MSSNINQRQIKSQIEITDLIEEAIVNASARRNQVLDAKEPLSELSDQEENGITGGLVKPIILGYFPTDLLI